MAKLKSKREPKTKSKKVIKNSMFLRPTHYWLFTLLLITYGFLMFIYSDQIENSGRRLRSYVDQVSEQQLADDYAGKVNSLLSDYYSTSGYPFTEDFWQEANTSDLKEKSQVSSNRLLNLKTTEEYKDFHLALLIIVNQIQYAEEMADFTLYQQAMTSLDNLSEQYTWLNFR
ncbi:hypothetical protein KKI23_01735 [Patescibacteria group bacterium]|nr:hypothetical protein [Patescibacteria group bacterium]